MADNDEDSWSDSSVSSTESHPAVTNTMLGFPDGPIETDADLDDPQTSQIGGQPSFLPSLISFPSAQASLCLTCDQPMELLVQVYAPLEHSLDDRIVYVFGCSRSGCQGPDGKGSVRSFTSRKRNEKYASAHERRAAKKAAAKTIATPATESSAQASNPFATAGSGLASATSAFNPFNPFSQTPSTATPASPFGNPFASSASASNPFAPASTPVPIKPASSPFSSEQSIPTPHETGLTDEVARLDIKRDETSEIGKTELDPAWKKTPFYPAHYLATQPERLSKPKISAAQKASERARAEAAAAAINSNSTGEDASLENLKGNGKGKGKESTDENDGWGEGTDGNGLDDTLDRFLNRLSLEPEQVIRYDLNAHPLFYSSLSPLYALLHPHASSSTVPDSSSGVSSAPTFIRRAGRTYDLSSIPRCKTCKKSRSFELQLVPGLLNTLKPESIVNPLPSSAPSNDQSLVAPETTTTTEGGSSSTRDTQKERSRQDLLQTVLSKTESTKLLKTGMEWGSVCVFSCTTDGCGGDWTEEWVGVEWEE